MRVFPGVPGILTAVGLLGCAPDASLGPRVAPGVAVTEPNASKAIGGSAKVYCNGTTCFAAAFEFKDSPGYTLFTATLQNLQGTYPPSGPSAVQPLNRFFFQFFDEIVGDDYIVADPAFRSFVTVGNLQVGQNNGWSNDSPIAGLSTALFWVTGYGIVGCSGGTFPFDFHFQTCPSQGLDGWVTVGFKLMHAGLAPKKAPVRFRDFRFSFGVDGGPSCTIGADVRGTCTELPYKRAIRN